MANEKHTETSLGNSHLARFWGCLALGHIARRWSLLCVPLAALSLVECKSRFEEASEEQAVLARSAAETRQRLAAIQAEFGEFQKAELPRLVTQGRIDSVEGFERRYRIVVGETESCFRPVETPGRVGLGIVGDEQQAQILANLRSIFGFVMAFDEAMGNTSTPLFRTVELCGVGKLAKHLPGQERTRHPLELQGKTLIVWNDKFVGGYELLRTDALLRQWNKGEIQSELQTGEWKTFAEKSWPLLNPIGVLRRSIRDRLRLEMSETQKELSGEPKGTDTTSGALRLAIDRRVTAGTPEFRKAISTNPSSSGSTASSALGRLSESQRSELVSRWSKCLSEESVLNALEEAGTCNSLARASQVSADQFNFALLVNVSNFHNINVSATACATDGMTRLFVEALPNEFELKQRCGSLLVSVCTVDNVSVFAQASLQPNAGPTWCFHRALQEIGVLHNVQGLPSL